MTRIRALAGCGLLVLLLAPVSGQQPGEFTFALTGDSIITRKLSVYAEPAFTRVIDLIRGADAAFTNLEMLFHDYEPYAMNESGGTYMRAEPALVKELVWAGFDMVSRANNHAGDYGVLGMNLTTKYVAEAGLVQAGVGQSLAEAREAKFLETPKGRVALISVASTFPDISRAGRTRGDMPARPGLNPLRFTTITTVTPERHGRRCAQMASGDQRPAARARRRRRSARRSTSSAAASSPAPRRACAPSPSRRISTRSPPWSKNAAGLADYTIVTIHAHEGGRDRVAAGGFPRDLRARDGRRRRRHVRRPRAARAARRGDLQGQADPLQPRRFHLPERDAAAAARAKTTSPTISAPTAHVNDFNDARYNFDKSGFPADRLIWEAVVAVPTFRGEQLTELALHPITLGFGKARSVRGRPQFAEGELGQKILGDLVKLSGGDGHEDHDPQRHRLRHAVAASKSTVRGATKRRHENTKNTKTILAS